MKETPFLFSNRSRVYQSIHFFATQPPFLLVSQGHGKVHDPRPQMMTADLKQIIVTTSLDWEKRHRTIMWGCLNELLSHRKGHEFILGPMSHKDWACNAGHLPEIVEALGHTQAHEGFRHVGHHGPGLLR